MEWRRRTTGDPADPHGVAELLGRACAAVSATTVAGTRFLFTTDQMLAVSREIEQACIVYPDDDLYVGAQRSDHLLAQADIYGILTAVGVTVHAFVTDGGAALDGVSWIDVPADPSALSANWFLVRGGDGPHALVGFEVDDHADGVDGRRWEGFETRDPFLVDGIIAHLIDIAGDQLAVSKPTHPAEP